MRQKWQEFHDELSQANRRLAIEDGNAESSELAPTVPGEAPQDRDPRDAELSQLAAIWEEAGQEEAPVTPLISKFYWRCPEFTYAKWATKHVSASASQATGLSAYFTLQ